MLLFGIVLTALGSVLPSVSERFELSRTSAGSLFSLLSIGVLVASVVFGPIVDRYGYRMLLALAMALVSLGLEGIAFAPAPALLAAAVLMIGFGGGILNGATSALVVDIYPAERSARLTLLGAFFGVGAFALPFVLGLLVESLGYTAVIAALSAVPALVLAYVLLVRLPSPKQEQGFPLALATRLVRDPTVLLLGLILFFESGMEITVGGWTTTYVNDVLALPPDRALYLLSLYWVGMTAARLVLGTTLRRLATGRILLPSFALAFAGASLLLLARSPVLAAPGALLVGAGFAPVFPTVMGLVGDRYPRLSGTAFSLVLVMALTGGTLLPFATGVLSEHIGLRLALAIVPAALLCSATTYLVVRRRLQTATPPVAAANPSP